MATAVDLQQQLSLAKIIFLPAALSPLKQHSLASKHRVAMLQLALADHERFALDSRELNRPPPSYTIDSLKQLRQEHGSQQPLAFIMGMDSFLNLTKWQQWQQLTDYAHLIIVTRPHYNPNFSPELHEWTNNHRCNDRQLLEYQANGLVFFATTQPYAISSSEIRAAIASGQPNNPALPLAVARYIQHHQLYGATATHES